MLKPPTGEPCAGEPHARFGGRGGDTLPDPYQNNPTARHSGESRNPEKRHGKQFPRFIEDTFSDTKIMFSRSRIEIL